MEKEASAMQQTAQTAASEAHAELKKEIAAATSEEADMAFQSWKWPETYRLNENRKPHPQPRKVEEVPRERKRSRLPLEALRCRLYSAAQLASRVKTGRGCTGYRERRYHQCNII